MRYLQIYFFCTKKAAGVEDKAVKLLDRGRSKSWLALKFFQSPMSKQPPQSAEELEFNYYVFQQKLAFASTLVRGLAKPMASKFMIKTCYPLQKIQT